ncbi:MAG: PIN domain-containing protein [Solirubrobacteraceae bacterium]
MSATPSLLDTSVWARLRDRRIVGTAAERIAGGIENGELAMTEPLLLEMRYSARDAEDFALLSEELGAMPLLSLDGRAVRRALEAQEQLAADDSVSHRVKPVDLLVAGVADCHRAAVLHYDSDYDLILEHTDLSFESVWVATRGSAG